MARVFGGVRGGGVGVRGGRSIKVCLLAAASAVLSCSVARAQDAYTTRIEPRPFYGATVTIEEGVRVFRPLPPHRQIIINPGQKTPLNLTFNETVERSYAGGHTGAASGAAGEIGSAEGAAVSADGADGYASGGYTGGSGGYARRAVGHNGHYGYKGMRLAGLGKHNVRVNGLASGLRQSNNSAYNSFATKLGGNVQAYPSQRVRVPAFRNGAGSSYRVGPRVNYLPNVRVQRSYPAVRSAPPFAYAPRMMAPRAVHAPAHAAMAGRPMMMMGRGRR
jgi:hypothetical protein